MRRLRWGVLSTAGVNRRLLAAASRSRRGEVVAVASRDASRAAAYAARHEIPRAYGSYQDLLDDDTVDVVYISLPNAFHLEWTERAVAAGKHVLCEKPLASDAGRLVGVLDAARRGSLHVTESIPFRHMPHIEALRELLVSGSIGRVRYATTALTYCAARDRNPRFQPELDGGALLDIGCYCCSALRLACGEPRRVAVLATRADAGVDVASSGVMADDWLAQFTVGIDAAVCQFLKVIGEEGAVYVPEPYRSTAATLEVQTPHRRQVLDYACPDPFDLEFENMTAAVLDEEPLTLGPKELVAQATVIEALRAASDAGRTLESTATSGGPSSWG